jgi:hypothetical protein
MADDVIENKHLPKIFIGTPCYGGQCFNNYVVSLLETYQYFKDKNVQASLKVQFLTNESLITRGRNTIVAKFLSDKTNTHLLFIDADISWHPSTIEKLLNANVDIVGAIYPKKSYRWANLAKILPDLVEISSEEETQNGTPKLKSKKIDDRVEDYIKSNLLDYALQYTDSNVINNNLLEIKHVGTGFMMIKREVLEKMCAKFPQYKFEDDIGILTKDENKWMYSLFDCEVCPQIDGTNRYYSEDYLFCKRWKEMGGKIYAEVTSLLTHTGTHTFQGNYLASLRLGPTGASLLDSSIQQDKPTATIELTQDSNQSSNDNRNGITIKLDLDIIKVLLEVALLITLFAIYW